VTIIPVTVHYKQYLVRGYKYGSTQYDGRASFPCVRRPRLRSDNAPPAQLPGFRTTRQSASPDPPRPVTGFRTHQKMVARPRL